MLALVAVFLVVAMIIVAVVLIAAIHDGWKYFQRDTEFSLTFNQFLKFRAIAPTRYDVTESYIRYGDFPYTYIGVKTLLDYLRYRLWLADYERAKTERESDQKLQEYIGSVRKDLEHFTGDGDKQ